ncbi:MAG TPA: hypothetical protein VGL99_06645 [Chloroflexota bacterium]
MRANPDPVLAGNGTRVGQVLDARQQPPVENDDYVVENEPGGMDDVDVWLMSTVAMIPMAGVLSHVLTYYWTYESTGTALWALGAGPATVVVLVFVLYQLYKAVHFNEAKHASVDTYNDLCVRMHHATSITTGFDVRGETVDAARATIDHFGHAFKVFRKKKGLHWVLGKGYVDLLRTVHRCEEAVIMFEPIDMVISEGKKDLYRLAGSTIPHRDELVDQVRKALTLIDPLASSYTKPAACEDPKPDITQQMQARQVLRDVRFAVNDFRDGAKQRLVEARNKLVARMFLTALSTSVLVIFIITAAPPAYVVLAGAVLYAVGAIVGLFARLYADQGESVMDDYGISHVRLFQTFLVSGLAGVAGVYLTVMVPMVLQNEIPKPQSAVSTPAVERTLPSVLSLYDLEQNRAGIVFAALFGLAPGLLVSRLSEGVEQYKKDLRSSETVQVGARPT